MKTLLLCFALLLPMVVGAQALPYNDTPTNLPATFNGSLAADDVNQDGIKDFLVSGSTDRTPSGTTSITEFYISNGNGNVTNVTNPFPGLHSGKAIFININNDGNSDAFVIGFDDNFQAFAATYLGNGNGGFTLHQTLTGLGFATACAGDLDGDGDDDLVTAGKTGVNGQVRTITYRNDNGI